MLGTRLGLSRFAVSNRFHLIHLSLFGFDSVCYLFFSSYFPITITILNH